MEVLFFALFAKWVEGWTLEAQRHLVHVSYQAP